jgi:AsmA protein
MKSKGMKVTALVAAVVFLAILALPYVVDVDRFRPQLEASLQSSLGRDVHIGHMQLSLLAGGARVDQISVAEDPAFNNGNFLQAKSLGVGVSILSLIFSRSFHVTSLTLEDPQLSLIKSSEGKWNFSTIGSATGGADENSTAEQSGSLAQSNSPSMTSIVLDRLKISNATIEISSGLAGQPATALKNIDVDLKNVSFDSAMSFVLSAHTDAGKLEIKGEAGPMNHDNPGQTPFHATITARKADLAQIASLGSSSALGGMLTLDGTVTSDGSTIHSEGKASADKLRLVRGAQPASQTISLNYETDYVVSQKTGVLRNSEIHAGKSVARLSGTYEARGKGLVVHMKIAGNQLPLDSVAGVLPALGVVLPGGSKLRGGTVDANLSLDGPADRVVTSGSAQIANAHLAGFDLGSKLSALPGLSGLKGNSDLTIVTLGTHLHIAPEGTQIAGLNGQFAGIGSVTGDGDVTASNQLNFHMVAHVASDGAVRFGLNHVGLRNLPNDIPFQVVGTTSVPVIIPDLSGMAKSTGKAAAKEVAKNAAKSAVQKIAGNTPKNAPATPDQAASNNKKAGFFHNLFHRKDKNNAAAGSTQLASKKTKF